MNIAAPKPVIVPDYSTPALTARGNGHLQASRYPQAAEMLEIAIAQQPRHMPAYNEMGNCLKSMGNHGPAIWYYERALRMAPGTAEIHQNLGATYLDLGDMQRAATHSITAITMNPRLDEARWNLAITLFSAGQLKEGWQHARARWRTPRFMRWAPKYTHPFWDGQEDAKVMVWGEQGLGERILFAPLVADLARKLAPAGGKVFCDCDKRMAGMLQRSFPEVEFVLENDKLDPGEITHQIGMGDLGGFFRETLESFPAPAAYLKPESRRARVIAREMRARTKKKVIGLSWKSGNSEYGSHKSMSLFDLVPIIELEDVICINLQYGDTAEERAALTTATGLAIADAGVDLKNDLESVAGLMMACDLVVSVSNTHAHLAGALGCPVALAIPRFNARFWYWFLDRVDSPWYSRVRIHRQTHHGRWEDVVQGIAKGIGELSNGGAT